MFTDERRYDVWEQIRQHDVRAFSGLLAPSVLLEAAQRTGVKVVKSPLCVINLIWLGVASALHCTSDFASVLSLTLKLLEDHPGFGGSSIGRAQRSGSRRSRRTSSGRKRSKHDPRRSDPTHVSEEAFAKARRRLPLEFWVSLLMVLGERFEAERGERVRFGRFRLLAMDGTHLDLPRYQALQKHFGGAKNATGSHNPQAQLVMLTFPLVRMPYAYELSPLSVGEVSVAQRLVPRLRKNDLVLLDAGFWSYGLLWAIQNRGACFAIRLKSTVCLRTLRRLGRRDRLVRWTPKDSRGQWRKQQLPRSIDLRVVEYQVPGFRPQAIVTNALDSQEISRDDWTRLTTACPAGRNLLPGLYHRRWEIETTYYELKVHQGLDRRLRSRTPESISYEVAGHVVLYLLVRWLMVQAAEKHGVDPLRLSYLGALRELLAMRSALVSAPTAWVARVLLPRLLERLATHFVPVRPGRHYARKKSKRLHPSNPSRKKAA